MSKSKSDQEFLSVIESNKGLIYKVALSYCKDDELRKDLIQDIILQLWKSFHNYSQEYKMSTWIYRIALNVSISYYRKKKRRTKISDELPEESLFLFEKEEPPTEENRVLLLQFISDLKEFDKAVILLHLEEKNHKEIAEILGISVSNVSTKVHRIKNQLTKKFKLIRK